MDISTAGELGIKDGTVIKNSVLQSSNTEFNFNWHKIPVHKVHFAGNHKKL